MHFARAIVRAGGSIYWIVPLASTLQAGCLDSEAKEPSVFGGQGAVVATPGEKPLPAQTAAPEDVGPCGRESPPSETALLDDFEDGDSKLFKGFQREGYWYGGSDNTEGSVIKPVGSGVVAELLPAAEATKENRFGAHLSAAGQKQWGATWGVGLSWTTKGIRCPLNVSHFSGIQFRAKGPGTIRLSVAVPEVMPKDAGGSCTDACYDSHSKLFILSDHWESYSVRWDRLQQGGWGAEARFTPSRVVTLSFNAGPKDLPIDFWLDDVELIENNANSSAAASAAGAAEAASAQAAAH